MLFSITGTITNPTQYSAASVVMSSSQKRPVDTIRFTKVDSKAEDRLAGYGARATRLSIRPI
jgi:hypothetical protein